MYMVTEASNGYKQVQCVQSPIGTVDVHSPSHLVKVKFPRDAAAQPGVSINVIVMGARLQLSSNIKRFPAS